MFHVAMMVLGLVLLWQAQQPVWMEQFGRKIWMGAKGLAMGRGKGAPLVIGMLWAFLPCGLLYSALLVAGLTGQLFDGALVMALFALGTSVSMMLGPWLWLRLKGNNHGDWGVRLAGLALAASSAWALWMAYAHNAAPWCVTS
jgi:sulfite exporter TauE/SafE